MSITYLVGDVRTRLARMDECRKALFDVAPELPGQGDLFAETGA